MMLGYQASDSENARDQPRSQSLLGFQYGGGSGEDPLVHSELKRSLIGAFYAKLNVAIHLIPKWPPFRYSFVFIEIRP